LFVFLYDVRAAVISVVAIPLSLVAAAATLAWRGATLDTMTVAGLVIALGEVVDDAIIDVENIQRRLQINAALERPRSALTVVLDASLEVRSAVVYATLSVVPCRPARGRRSTDRSPGSSGTGTGPSSRAPSSARASRPRASSWRSPPGRPCSRSWARAS
jgi:hypothetical protein